MALTRAFGGAEGIRTPDLLIAASAKPEVRQRRDSSVILGETPDRMGESPESISTSLATLPRQLEASRTRTENLKCRVSAEST